VTIIIPANSAADTAYEVANSLRIDDGGKTRFYKTLGTPTSTKIFTISLWIKRVSFGTVQFICNQYADGNDWGKLFFDASDNLNFFQNSSGSTQCSLITSAKFRDPSAWMHICVAVDTTDGTAANRNKMYINGTQVTEFSTETNFSADDVGTWNSSGNVMTFGRNADDGSSYLDCYLAEAVFIDGTQNAVTDFGEFNSDSPTIWQPIDVSGLTFGNNGHYLDFEDSGTLGNDANGGTDFTLSYSSSGNAFSAADQATDTPTNNFCTMNSLDTATGFTISEGNCKLAWSAAATNFGVTKAIMGVSAGKWYFEVKYTFGNAGQFGFWDVNDTETNSADIFSAASNSTFEGLAWRIDSSGNIKECADGQTDDTNVDFTSENILGVAFDADAGKIYAFQNNTEITNQDIGAGTSLMTAVTVSDFYLPFVSGGDGGSGTKTHTSEVNFGGCPSFALSSAAADENGYGAFEYAPPSGFLALCTKNLGSDGG